MTDTRLLLKIEMSQLDKFCHQLLARSRDIVKTHESLITLETFIKVFSSAQQGSEGYIAIEALLNRYTEQTRQQLLQQKTLELAQALHSNNIQAVADIHTPLSRNGFYQILQDVAAALSTDEIRRIYDWVGAWTVTAKQSADQQSKYPDAPDFHAAGIALEEYLAMVDVDRYLKSIVKI